MTKSTWFSWLAFVLTLTSCTKSIENSKEVLIVALGASPNTLDPRFASDASGMRIASLLFNSLVRVGPNLQIVGEAAEKWEYKDKIYTFTLRPGLLFSDGKPVTADDFRFSFEQFMSPKCPFHSSFKEIKKVDVQYDEKSRHVKLHLHSFSATLLNDLSPLKILPKEAVETAGDDFAKVLVGTGSFSFVKQDANEIVLRAKENHFLTTPKVKRVVFKIIRDDNTRYLKTLKGEIDIAQSEIPFTKVAEFRQRSEFQVFDFTGLSMSYILLNLKNPLFQNLKVRQALAQAVNRDEIIQFKLDGFATPATSLLGPASPFHHRGLENLKLDIGAAKAAFEATGLAGNEIILKTSNAQGAVENGKVLANQLEQAGLKMKLQSYEWGTFYGDIQKGNFQMATMRWVGALDPDIYRTALHSSEAPPKGRNRGFYANANLDKLLEAGITIEDPEKRRLHYSKIQEIVQKDLPIIPLWYDKEVAIVHSRVKGYVPPQNGDYSPLTQVSKE